MLLALVLGLIWACHALKVIIVFIVEQTIEGSLILGSLLNIHPINVPLVLLTSGSVWYLESCWESPVYASAKVVISAIFNWYKKVSGLYEEEGEEIKSEQ